MILIGGNTYFETVGKCYGILKLFKSWFPQNVMLTLASYDIYGILKLYKIRFSQNVNDMIFIFH